ncbi:hypothetical protein GW17_00049370, partial [Ensete ventricosum]
MRLNHVESFYEFLLHFCSKRSEEEDGQPATARPSCRGGRPRPGHLQGGDRLWPRPPAQGVVGCGQPVGATSPGGTARKVLLACGEATGTAPTRGQPVKGRRPPPAQGQL